MHLMNLIPYKIINWTWSPDDGRMRDGEIQVREMWSPYHDGRRIREKVLVLIRANDGERCGFDMGNKREKEMNIMLCSWMWIGRSFKGKLFYIVLQYTLIQSLPKPFTNSNHLYPKFHKDQGEIHHWHSLVAQNRHRSEWYSPMDWKHKKTHDSCHGILWFVVVQIQHDYHPQMKEKDLRAVAYCSPFSKNEPRCTLEAI